MTTQFVTSIKKGQNSYELGKSCASDAFSKLKEKNVSLCTIFASIDYDLKEVVKGIRSVIGQDAQIIGASSCGEFTEKEFLKNSISVGLINSTDYKFLVKSEIGLKENVDEVFERLKKKFNNMLNEPGKTSAIMLIDGLCGIGEEATLSAIAAFETEMKIVGGAAGDNLAFKETKVIANDEVLSNAVAFCLVKGPEYFFSGVDHGHKPLSETLEATKAKANVLYTINNRPAFEVWKEKTKNAAKEIGIDVDLLKDASSIGSFLLQFELGFETENGYKIRVPLSVGQDDSINFACTIPGGVKFKIMKSDKKGQINSANSAAKMARKSIGKKKISGALVFDCVCRALYLGDKDFWEAIKTIKSEIGDDVPLQGYETYGEICMDPNQFSGFHNTTSVITLIAG